MANVILWHIFGSTRGFDYIFMVHRRFSCTSDRHDSIRKLKQVNEVVVIFPMIQINLALTNIKSQHKEERQKEKTQELLGLYVMKSAIKLNHRILTEDIVLIANGIGRNEKT